MIKFFKSKKSIVIYINGHYKSEICNFISTLTQFSQFVMPKMFVHFERGETVIFAKNRNEYKFVDSLIKYLSKYLDQNNICYEVSKIKSNEVKIKNGVLNFNPI